jgi:hypothetical protein
MVWQLYLQYIYKYSTRRDFVVVCQQDKHSTPGDNDEVELSLCFYSLDDVEGMVISATALSLK